MPKNDNDHLIEECKRIENDCLRTAETHYIIAAAAGKAAFWVKLIPAIAAAVSGVALLSGLSSWIAWLSVIAGVAFALQSIMNPDKKQEEHSQAGKCYTVLKHESRALHETFYREIDHNSFHIMVCILRMNLGSDQNNTMYLWKKCAMLGAIFTLSVTILVPKIRF